ncbi:DNA excision repair protein ERCC-1-like [Salvia miltiorrhiza]|uniref:DNA excision repair protein ERCC-1-like n=1 Tax=Salvia miltiorrhiza TaxID=226208 RepID=UPI0025AD1AA3|nr:DNA excision repair protein ERCC-1-like [Salvia miltiorrhiza]
MENRGDPEQQKQNNASFVVKIPSYEEVVESSQPKSQSLFKPSSSFSQAFNFIKNTEFYTTPPSAPVAQSSKDAPSSSQGSHPRQTIHSEAPSTSVSSAAANRNAIIVSHRQKGNPLLKHIRNVRWVFADVVCDYLLGQNTCALYLRFEVKYSFIDVYMLESSTFPMAWFDSTLIPM